MTEGRFSTIPGLGGSPSCQHTTSPSRGEATSCTAIPASFPNPDCAQSPGAALSCQLRWHNKLSLSSHCKAPHNSLRHLETFTKATHVVLPLGLIACVQQLWERPDLLYQVIRSSLPRRWVKFPISPQKAALAPARAGQGDFVPGAAASFRGPAAPPCGACAETPLGAERSAARLPRPRGHRLPLPGAANSRSRKNPSGVRE